MALSAPPLHRVRTKIFFVPPTARVVSELPTARKPGLYLLLRLRSNRHITCVQCERATLPILNHMPQTFSLLPVFGPVLSKGASRAKIVWHLSMLLSILFINIFLLEFIFPKFFLSKLFSKIFFSIFFVQNLKKFFFSKIKFFFISKL